MSILEKLTEDIKTAMKAAQAARLSTLRMMKSAAKNKEIELMHALSEGDFITILSTMVKQRQEAIAQYNKAGQGDRAAAEQAELGIIREYLPKPLGEGELKGLVAAAVSKVGAKGPKDMGTVMKELKEATTGRVDGKLLADQVKAALKEGA